MERVIEQRSWKPSCRPRRAARAEEIHVVITCRVCGTREHVTLSNDVLLCQRCRTDRAYALSILHRRAEAAKKRFHQIVAAASAVNKQRYGRMLHACHNLTTSRKHDAVYRAALEQRLAAAQLAGDELSTILRAETHMQAILRAIERAREEVVWCENFRTSV